MERSTGDDPVRSEWHSKMLPLHQLAYYIGSGSRSLTYLKKFQRLLPKTLGHPAKTSLGYRRGRYPGFPAAYKHTHASDSILAGSQGIGPRCAASETAVLPLNEEPTTLAVQVGVGPTSYCLTGNCSTIELPHIKNSYASRYNPRFLATMLISHG